MIHPGHDRELVDRIVAEWREEFGVVCDGREHVAFRDVAGDAHDVVPLTEAGTVLVDRLVAAGVLSKVQ